MLDKIQSFNSLVDLIENFSENLDNEYLDAYKIFKEYNDIEDMGVILPVVELNIKYLRPAKYDDLITIKSQIKTLPTDHKIIFDQEVYNEAGKLLTVGQVKLYFMDASMHNKIEMPAILKEKLSVYFS